MARSKIKKYLIAFAVLLAADAAWNLVPELVRPYPDAEGTFAAFEKEKPTNSLRFRSDLAASLAVIRGDLWAERLYVEASNILDGKITKDFTSQDADAAREAAYNAAKESPINAKLWLLLAEMTASIRHDRALAAQQLKMSYYTGPSDKIAMRHRLPSAVIHGLLDDSDLRDVVRHEIQVIVRRAPDLRSVIVDAHRKGKPGDREFIETTVTAVDPAFAAVLRSQVSEPASRR